MPDSHLRDPPLTVGFDAPDPVRSGHPHIMGLNRTGVYYQPRPVPQADLQLMGRIDELHLQFPYYGARRLAEQLKREGCEVGRLHVRSLMRRLGIAALYHRPRTSIPARGASIYAYLLENLVIERPGQAWSSDITYLPMAHGFFYLVAILDIASNTDQGSQFTGENWLKVLNCGVQSSTRRYIYTRIATAAKRSNGYRFILTPTTAVVFTRL